MGPQRVGHDQVLVSQVLSPGVGSGIWPHDAGLCATEKVQREGKRFCCAAP